MFHLFCQASFCYTGMDMSEKKQIRRNSRKKNIFFTYQIELAGSLIGIFLTVGLLAVILLIIFFSLENSSTTSPLPWQYLYSDKSEDMIKDAEGNIVPGKKKARLPLLSPATSCLIHTMRRENELRLQASKMSSILL